MTGRYLKRKTDKLLNWISGRLFEIRRLYTKKCVKSRDFTIISNNCWAGSVYRYFNMPYLSPTVGLYFFADDYLKFVADLRHYVGCELRFISASESRYAEVLKKREQLHIPVGVLDDVEVIFLHYPTAQEAKEKWERRASRINWDNVFIKFSRMNLCTDEHIKKFAELPFDNKFVLNTDRKPKYDCEYYWAGENEGNEIIADTRPFPGRIMLTKLLRKKAMGYPYYGLEGGNIDACNISDSTGIQC